GATCTRASDEHCIVALAPGTPAPRVGARLKLVPGHIDPTVNLHDWLVLTEGERVGALWPVAARGAVA
ncbi:MAG: DSD1 family PLP-dependent enzyme, partial [Alphaproteobacteria bacterium]|nr:DSD1 family PLP-dependent enzyme [Alphaproteobacteria bacterium]